MKASIAEKGRESNFEALRLVAILFIILHHLVIKSAATCGYTHIYSEATDGHIGLIINGLAVGGVNLFLLISGWFGAKHILQQVIRLILDCFVYSLIANTFCMVVLGYPFSWSELLYSCNFVHNWFVASFVMFLFMTPIIEKGITDIDLRTMGYFVLLATLVNVVFGYILGQLNTNGYNAMNFAYLYIIGRYLKMLSEEKSYRHFAKWGIGLWMVCAIILAVGFVVASRYIAWNETFSQRYFGYNNPFVVMSSVGLFCTFSMLHFHSKIVNLLAKGVFGVFLLHTTSICIYYRVTIIGNHFKEFGYTAIFVWTIVLFVACMFVACCLEKIKKPCYELIINKLMTKLNMQWI